MVSNSNNVATNELFENQMNSEDSIELYSGYGIAAVIVKL